MSDDNKRSLLYFESSSMRELYNDMENWQNGHPDLIPAGMSTSPWATHIAINAATT